MAHDQNGRGITGPGNGMRGPSGRSQDQRDMHGRDDEVGQGQSGYGAGRFGDDRAMMETRNRNQSDRGGRGEEHERGFGIDDRFSGGRGGEEYWLDRPERGGGHRGKGPRGYARSDERIREIVCEALTDHDGVDASNIDVVVNAGEVTLSGTVEDRRQKRLAEDVVEACAGVKDVSNQLKLGGPGSSRTSSHDAGNPNRMTGVGTDKPRA